MSKTFWALLILWLAIFLPGMIAGALWSGSLPLWPPVQGGQLHDRIVWAVLFIASYGIPLFLIASVIRKRVQTR